MTSSQSVRLRGFSGYHHVQAEVTPPFAIHHDLLDTGLAIVQGLTKRRARACVKALATLNLDWSFRDPSPRNRKWLAVKGAAKPIVSHFMQQSVKVGGGGVPLGRDPNAGGGTTASQADNQATSKVRGVGAHR